MSAETDRLEREAESHRRRLDSTLEQLEGKLSASAVVDEVADYLRNGQGATMLRDLGQKVRDNPVALGIISAGVAWLLLGRSVRRTARGAKYRYRNWRENHRHEDESDTDYGRRFSERDPQTGEYRYSPATSGNGSRSYRQYSGSEVMGDGDTASRMQRPDDGSSDHSVLHDAKDRLYQASHKVSDTAQSAGNWARERLHEGTDAAKKATRAAKRSGLYVSREGRRLVDEGRERFSTTMQEQPLVVGAIAVAIGAAIGAMLPATQRENELLGKTRDELRDKAVELGEDIVDKAKHVADTALHAADEKAGEVGLKPQGGETLADKVATVAETAVDAAKEDAKKQGLL